MEHEDPVVLYIIVRSSLNMSIGKTAAQVGHCVQMIMQKYFEDKFIYDSYEEIGIDPPLSALSKEDKEQLGIMEKWLSTDYRKVVLKADKEWERIKAEIPNHVLVKDNGLTELEPGTETVIGLFPQHKCRANKIIKRLQVLR